MFVKNKILCSCKYNIINKKNNSIRRVMFVKIRIFTFVKKRLFVLVSVILFFLIKE